MTGQILGGSDPATAARYQVRGRWVVQCSQQTPASWLLPVQPQIDAPAGCSCPTSPPTPQIIIMFLIGAATGLSSGAGVAWLPASALGWGAGLGG